jgi:hypothetical protein
MRSAVQPRALCHGQHISCGGGRAAHTRDIVQLRGTVLVDVLAQASARAAGAAKQNSTYTPPAAVQDPSRQPGRHRPPRTSFRLRRGAGAQSVARRHLQWPERGASRCRIGRISLRELRPRLRGALFGARGSERLVKLLASGDVEFLKGAPSSTTGQSRVEASAGPERRWRSGRRARPSGAVPPPRMGG